jgi:sterol desaturase/sphingolipid hydroxylase (fatty acid hydroxylase superfamily)
VHTQFLPPLGPLEWVLATPSFSRVHHARNYPRKNFGAMFSVWDRLCGTYEAEKTRSRPCAFGLDERQVRAQSTRSALLYITTVLLHCDSYVSFL